MAPFSDPRVGGILHAPIGPGVYELQQAPPDGSLVLVGMGSKDAARMSSLLPIPLGCGNRNAADKRSYVLVNLGTIEHRALACATKE